MGCHMLAAQEANHNARLIGERQSQNRDDHDNRNGGNGNHGNNNGDRNRNGGNGGAIRNAPVTKACTYNDFLNCKPRNFNGTKGVVGLVSDNKLEAPQSPGQASLSLDYVPGPEHPPLPDYVHGLEESEQAPLSPDYPLPDDSSPTALSPGYVADSDPEEDPEENPAEYPIDGGDDDDDNDDDDKDDEEDEEDEEKEEHLALANSIALHTVDPFFSTEDT
ncbi:hypothetical protein Tco_0195005 [Tanacetum coccineum]